VTENRFETLPVNSLPLGIGVDSRYDQWQTISINPGDILIAFTDGFFECENASGNRIGTERICKLMLYHANLSADEILKSV
jgi:serine phosphatase RsbU (regulator of sigma subunit)